MYKLIIGNVRVSVTDDSITHVQAIQAARKAIAAALTDNKYLSHIELLQNGDEIETVVTERTGSTGGKKTLKQSMLDSIIQNITEKLLPPAESMTRSDYWQDSETGQEWRGSEVKELRRQMADKLADLVKNMEKNC